MEAIPLSICCATDKELLAMSGKTRYSDYYHLMIRDEMRKRGLITH
jgi:hypothetical protein